METPIDIARHFDTAWNEETYTPPWRKAIEGLTPEQAVWKPEGAKHSIWQLVEHMAFWREQVLHEMGGGERDEAEIARRNWPETGEITAEAWTEAVGRLAAQHEAVKSAMEGSDEAARKLHNFIEHDAYHFGQIMLLRALQGLPPLDSFG